MLDKDSRAAILSALDEINSGKLPLLKAGDMERLETLQNEMDELAKTMKPSSEQMARLGESISKIVDVSIQQRPLDAEGKKMMFIHQVKDGEVTVHLNSLDEAKLHFDLIKNQIEDANLTNEQKAELRAMLAK